MSNPSLTRSNGRDLLRALGIGNFNATMIIQYLFIAPATTDPKSSAIILLVKALQRAMNRMGAGLVEHGYIDNKTAIALHTICGLGWEQRPWADIAQAVLRAEETGVTWRDDSPPPPNYGPSKMQLGSMPLGLPDVPGGILTYGIAAVVGYHLWKKKRKG